MVTCNPSASTSIINYAFLDSKQVVKLFSYVIILFFKDKIYRNATRWNTTRKGTCNCIISNLGIRVRKRKKAFSSKKNVKEKNEISYESYDSSTVKFTFNPSI